ncbi:hypothetical protein Aeqsu_1464 [Aequorivita sublithincola DSM 14238]|uniref:Secretion system C-terminal sorting domain-containing protein n=1 Tax=Aequorivita sublithincola (strain DSM 14238 / LMG 21431 / ACAM 643 / 9-3) TaxID=746697 RepID=I3YVD7_AEQSU|nr:T9SS type A sorting domain-containing protein [Aequorivita sublithincola]AFL80955.1 hypothetical protein Aeqsu_1464 [Aequorivita sublithincola DSM 14238]
MKPLLLPTIIACALFINSNAQINFHPRIIIDQGSTNAPRAAFAADLDGDGHLDLVSASEYDSKVAWYKNDGAGNLGAQQIISLDVISPFNASAVDFDNDGNIDILVSSAEKGKIFWFKNDGSANFGSPRLITNSVNGISNSIATDIDGDGDMDVLATSADTNKIIWFENTNGQGNFGPENLISNNVDRAIHIAVSDLDGDGDLDIISSTLYGPKTVWFENLNGQGNYGPEQLIDDARFNVYALYGFDVDADGDNDIVTNKDGELIYYENLNGQGNFSTAQTLIADNVSYFQFKDFDQDADLDILAQVNGDIVWYENLNGLGDFGNKQILKATERITILNFADINGNGGLDIITGNIYQDKVAWTPNNGQNSYVVEIVLSIIDGAQGSYSVQAADIDGDGNIDAISANADAETITWYKNTDGQGNFGPTRIVAENLNYVQSVFVADLDGDGDMDVLSATNENNLATWFKNIDGQGNFIQQPPFASDFQDPSFVTSDDLDADGDKDVIVFDFNLGLTWFENLNGLGNFGQAQIIDGFIGYSESIHTVDIDGDGDKDIITAIYSQDKMFAWYENLDGQGNFGPKKIIEDNILGAIEIYYSDLDGDGDIDILGSITREGMVVWYENINGTGTFGPRKIIANPSPTTPEGIRTIDADQDGDLDVFVADYTADTVSWYENMDGQGNFGPQHIIDTNINGVLSLDTADFNNNGKMDLLAGALLGDKLKWYDNFGTLAVEDNNLDATVLYPVPTSDILNIKSNSIIVEVVVYNELGQNLLSIQNTEGINSLNIATLSNGIYIIKLKDLKQNSISKKFIKQN